jgi:hypothetical protein
MPSTAPWSRQDLFFLKSSLRRGSSIAEVARFLGRHEGEVREKGGRTRNLQREGFEPFGRQTYLTPSFKTGRSVSAWRRRDRVASAGQTRRFGSGRCRAGSTARARMTMPHRAVIGGQSSGTSHLSLQAGHAP